MFSPVEANLLRIINFLLIIRTDKLATPYFWKKSFLPYITLLYHFVTYDVNNSLLVTGTSIVLIGTSIVLKPT